MVVRKSLDGGSGIEDLEKRKMRKRDGIASTCQGQRRRAGKLGEEYHREKCCWLEDYVLMNMM